MLAGMEQTIMDQGPNWTEIVTCLVGALAVMTPLIIWWFKKKGGKG